MRALANIDLGATRRLDRFAINRRVVQGLLRGLCCVVPLLIAPEVGRAAPGDLDPTFGSGGVVVDTLGGTFVDAFDAVLEPSGSIVIAGAAMLPSEGVEHCLVARFTASGVLDPTFGDDGVARTIVGETCWFTALERQEDGRLVAAGIAVFPDRNDADVVVVRYDEHGALDPTFGDGGIVVDDLDSIDNTASGVLVAPDGKVVVAVNSPVPGGGPFDRLSMAIRYRDDGTRDPSFGIDGVAMAPAGTVGFAYAIARQSNGSILLGGYKGLSPNYGALSMVRFAADGTFDSSFANGGLFLETRSVFSTLGLSEIAVGDDDTILAAATVDQDLGRGWQFAVVRLDADGNPDPAFGDAGLATHGDWIEGYAFAVQPDGKIVIGGIGASSSGVYSDFTVMRLEPDGTLDASFGTGGIANPPVAPTSSIQGLVVQQDGDLLAAGPVRTIDGRPALALARYFGTDQGCADEDADGICDAVDNCLSDMNPDQRDSDGQGGGDVCDPCPADASDTCATDASVSGTIAAGGGLVTTPDATIAVDVPPGAVAVPTSFSVTGGLVASDHGVRVGDTTVLAARFEPSGVTFDPPVRLVFRWQDADDDGRVDPAEGGDAGVDEGALRIWRNGVALTPRCAEQTCSAQACCDAVANTWTVTVSEFSEYVLGEVECTAAAKGSVKLTRLLPPSGDDRISVSGEGTLPVPLAPALDPGATGARVEVRAADGTTLLDAAIPGGAYDKQTKVGWRANRARTSWTYQNANGPAGIAKVIVRQASRPAGLIKFTVTGKKAALSVAPDAMPLTARLVLDPGSEATGQCVGVAFPPASNGKPRCATKHDGATVSCR